jgi:hypothetical protein
LLPTSITSSGFRDGEVVEVLELVPDRVIGLVIDRVIQPALLLEPLPAVPAPAAALGHVHLVVEEPVGAEVHQLERALDQVVGIGGVEAHVLAPLAAEWLPAPVHAHPVGVLVRHVLVFHVAMVDDDAAAGGVGVVDDLPGDVAPLGARIDGPEGARPPGALAARLDVPREHPAAHLPEALCRSKEYLSVEEAEAQPRVRVDAMLVVPGREAVLHSAVEPVGAHFHERPIDERLRLRIQGRPLLVDEHIRRLLVGGRDEDAVGPHGCRADGQCMLAGGEPLPE